MINVTAAVIKRDNLIFSARRAEDKHLAGYWEFPGGKIETGETPEVCLARELAEELGITVNIGAFIAESCFDYGDRKIRLLAYFVEHLSGEFKLIDHDKMCWLPINELETLKWAPADLPIIEALKLENKSSKTSEFYNTNAQAYFDETINSDIAQNRQRFLSLIPTKSRVLDLGCGSGRDSRFFIDAGYQVTAMDASQKLAALASTFIGQPVVNEPYQMLNALEEYEGIWACASLLHCSKQQINDVFERCIAALQPNGLWYFSFKCGEGEREDERGRFFNDYTVESLRNFINDFPQLEIEDIWQETKPLRGSEQCWVNGLVRKKSVRLF